MAHTNVQDSKPEVVYFNVGLPRDLYRAMKYLSADTRTSVAALTRQALIAHYRLGPKAAS